MSYEHRAKRGYPSDDFLFWYVATYKPKALFNLLTQKDQRVLKYATRGVVQEMPGYEFRALLAAWNARGDHPEDT